MRTMFLHEGKRAESAELRAWRASVHAFWKTFEARREELRAALLSPQGRASAVPDALAPLNEALSQLHAALGCDAAIRESADTCELWITRQGVRELAPQVAEMVRSAPAFPDWTLLAGAPPLKLELAVERARRHLDTRLSRARFRAGVTRGHLLELTLFLPGASRNDAASQLAASVLAEGLLGERVLDEWIAELAVDALPGGGVLPVAGADDDRPMRPLRELTQTIAAASEGIRAGLPDEAVWLRDEGWTLLEASPCGDDPLVAPQMDDLVVATTQVPELLKAFLEGLPIASQRFTRHAERFCYLKYRDSGVLSDRVSNRDALEDELSDLLQGEGLGAVIGNGVGLAHTYLLLSLAGDEAELRDTLGRLSAALRESLPKASWIEFCDAEWADEWWPIHDDAPQPP